MITPYALGMAFSVALGAVVGSFLNVVIHRVPRGESIVRPASRCPGCGRGIRPLENVPILSWLALRGRCRGCDQAISWRYPAIEGACAVLFGALFAVIGPTPMLPVWMLFAAGLLAASVIDFEHQWIPDSISLGGLAVGLVLVPAVAWFEGAPYLPALLSSLLGAVVGGGMLWSVGFLHARVSVAMGREFDHWPGEGEPIPRPASLDYWTWFPGLGFGDVKLLAMIGAFLGPVRVVETVVAAAVAGLVLGLGFAMVRRSFEQPFGFGPAIAAGAVLVLFLGDRLGTLL